MSNLKFKVGDHVRITNYDGKVENCATSFIESMIGNAYIINSIEGRYYRINSELFTDDELELVETKLDELVPVSKILVVNKIRPEYTTYVDRTKEAIEQFFIGTRIFDFYVIKDGKLISLEKDSDLKKVYAPTTFSRDELMQLKYENDTIMIFDRKFQLGSDVDINGNTWLIEYGTGFNSGYPSVYLKRKGEVNAWYTLEEFADMLETGEYYFD